MSQRRPMVKYIPAGIKLSSRDYINLSSKTEPTEKDTKSIMPNVIQPSSLSSITPPKTICKNRNLNTNRSTEASNVNFQEKNVNHVTNGHCKPEAFDNWNSTQEACFGDNNSTEVSQHVVNGTNHATSAPQELSTSLINGQLDKSKLVSNNHTTSTGTTGINFKTIIYQRLNQAKLKTQSKETESKTNNITQKKVTHPEESCHCGNVDCENFINCTTWCDLNLCFNKTRLSRNSISFFLNDKKQQFLTRKINHKMVLEGPFIPRQVGSLSETFLHTKVQSALQSFNCSWANDMQSYMWLAIQRGLNAVIVASPNSGKTLSYLPSFCSFCAEKNGKYRELSKYEGPLIIILSPSVKTCDQLENLTKTLTVRGDVSVEKLIDESCHQINECDILITTPALLERYLRMGIVKIQRLCHLAIEEAHLLLKNYHGNMTNLLKLINMLQTNRPHNKIIQLVATSEKWSIDLETLTKKLYAAPLRYFDNFLEAAICYKIQFNKKKLKSLHKIFYLDDILKTKYMTHKSVVFCKQEEIAKMKEHLELTGVECIVISHYSEEDDIFENENMWNTLQSGYFKVLLCTDLVFEKIVKIVGADWLIHYSIPDDSTQFQKRFRCLANHFYSAVINNEKNCSLIRPQCFIILDETHPEEMILNFFDTLTRNSIPHLQL